MGATGRIFEWDERKRRSNLRKHGLDFRDCAALFTGPVVTVLDDRYDYGEARYHTLGLLDGRVVSVVHTEDDSGLTRIISLRKADKDEQTYYFETLQD
jgi:uncharacterized DUF497 family protein